MHEPANVPALSRADQAALLLLVLALATPYTISQFLRNAIAVVAPDLAAEFALTPLQTGLLASIFFLSFALVQLPLGAFIDVRGPRQAILIGIGFVVAGSILFALSSGLLGLMAGRLLTGVGCGAFYMCALTIYARRYPPARFSMIAGFHLGIGNLGALAATYPLAFSTQTFGWRLSFGAVALFAMAAAIGVILVAPIDRRPDGQKLDWSQAFQGLGDIARIQDFWPIFYMHAISVAIFVSVAGLWAGPWLSDIYGFDLAGRGRMLLLISICQIIGVFVIGASDRLIGSYRIPVMVCAGAVAVLLLLAAVVQIPLSLLPIWLCLFGFFVGFTPVLTAHGRSLFSQPILGRGLTVLNFGVMAGAFFVQTATGWIIQAVAGPRTGAYPHAAYAAIYAALGVVILVLLVSYSRTRERHPSLII